MKYWRVKAYDEAGNTNVYSSIWSVRYEKGPEVISLISPKDGYITKETNIKLIWLSKTGVYSNEVMIGSNVYVVIGTNLDVALGEGSYKWKVRGIDDKGIRGEWSEEREIIVDKTKPEKLVVKGPSKGEEKEEGKIRFEWEKGVDNVGIDYYEIWIDGNIYRVEGSKLVYEKEMKEGEHRWKIRAVDKAGNYSDWSKEIVFLVKVSTELGLNEFRVIPRVVKRGDVDNIIIEYNADGAKDVKFKVFTIIGDCVKIYEGEGTKMGIIEVGDRWTNQAGKELASGVYLILMEVDGKIVNSGKPYKIVWIR